MRDLTPQELNLLITLIDGSMGGDEEMKERLIETFEMALVDLRPAKKPAVSKRPVPGKKRRT